MLAQFRLALASSARCLPAALCSATLALTGVFTITPARAEDQATYQFDLPEQSLAEALRAIARQTGANVLFESKDLNGIKAPALRAQLTVAEAIDRILTGTKLQAERTTPTTVVVRLPLSASQSSSSSEVPAETSESASQQRIELEEIVVTGTHIHNAEPTSPVLSFGRMEIERGGYTSVQDVFKQIPQNFSSSTTSTGGSNIGGSSQIDLRGLGSKSTLTLVNGRRVSSAGGDRGRAVDVSMIPIVAIERIEVLTDGASALYGSDAIGGVVNLILRRDFEGSETSVQYGHNSTGSDDLLASQVLGIGWESGRILAAAQYRKNEALAYRAIDIGTFDFRSKGGSDQRTRGLPDSTHNGTVFPLGLAFATPGVLAGATSATLPLGNGRSLTASQLGLNQVSFGDFGFDGSLAPEEEDASAYVSIEQDVGSVTLFADGVFGHRTNLFDQGVTIGNVIVPRGCSASPAPPPGAPCNPFSPFAEPVLVFTLLEDFGPIVNDVERDGWFANLGARGELGLADWTWEIIGTSSEDESDTATQGLLDPNVLGSQTPTAPAGRIGNPDPNLAFNPFGDGSGQAPGVIEAMRLPVVTSGLTKLKGGSALMQGSLWQMPAGSARLALGADYREEDLDVRQLQMQAVGDVLSSVGRGSRDVAAVFGELYVPIVSETNRRAGLRDIALSAALRYESYSDFGGTTNPKLGILWRPIEDLAFKANWGTSFRAPSLIELYATQIIQQAVVVNDPNRPAGTPANVIVSRVQGGNADLNEETADTYTVAAEYRPRWLEGARLALNYFHTDYDDRIRGSLDGLGQAALFQYESSLPPGILVRRADGTLQSVNNVNVNSANTVVAGLDVMLGYSWLTQAFGGFDLSASATHYIRYDDQLIAGAPVIALAGKVGNPPDWRGRANLSWLRGPWGASISANYADELLNADVTPIPIVLREVESQTTVDLQLSFSSQAQGGWLDGVAVRVGATNLFDERPPFVDGNQRRGLDVRNSIFEGRTLYVRVSKGFGAAAQQSGARQ